MNEEAHTQWQVLHRRVGRGEVLAETEQAVYDTGCRELDTEECLDNDLVRLRELRARIGEAEAEQRLLREREAELDAQIKELERSLDQRTRHLLGVAS